MVSYVLQKDYKSNAEWEEEEDSIHNVMNWSGWIPSGQDLTYMLCIIRFITSVLSLQSLNSYIIIIV